MTVERARKLAEGLDSKTDRELTELRLDPPHKVLSQIRAGSSMKTQGLWSQ